MIEKKSPSTFDNKIVNCSHQTTIFHWNWKEKLRFVGGLVVHLQKFPPNLGRIGCVSQVINPTNLNFSFQFQWKMVIWWLQFTILLSNSLGLFFYHCMLGTTVADTIISVLVHWLWPKQKVLFGIGFGWKEKWLFQQLLFWLKWKNPFGHTLLVISWISNIQIQDLVVWQVAETFEDL